MTNSIGKMNGIVSDYGIGNMNFEKPSAVSKNFSSASGLLDKAAADLTKSPEISKAQKVGDKKNTAVKQRFVLLIGINDYERPEINDLSCCENDVDGFKRVANLKGAKVTMLKSRAATKGAIIEWFNTIAKLVKPGDDVDIVYSGHGTNIDGDGCICPADAKINGTKEEVKNSMLSGKELASLRESLGSVVFKFINDSCFSGAISGEFGGAKFVRKGLVSRYLNTKYSGKNFNQDAFYSNLANGAYFNRGLTPAHSTIILAASSANEYSQEDPNAGYGLLMGALITAMQEDKNGNMHADKNKDGSLSLAGEAYRWCYEMVQCNDKGKNQHPQIFYSGEYGGQYWNSPIKSVK